MLDLESEVMRGLGSIPTGGNILSLDFLFSCSKDKNAKKPSVRQVYRKDSIFLKSERQVNYKDSSSYLIVLSSL